MSTFRRYALLFVIFAVAFFLLQRLMFVLRFPPFQRTTVWTPGALTFAALLLTEPRRWWIFYPALCLGAFAAYYGDPAIPQWQALVAAQFHFLAVAGGAWAIRRFSPHRYFGTPAALLVFILVAGLVVPTATTLPIDLARWLKGADDVVSVALRSLLCVALGIIIATPAITLTLEHGAEWLRKSTRARIAELLAIEILLLAVGHFAFGSSSGGMLPAMLYAPVPLLLWAALRFGLAAVCWALLALAYQSTWGAIHGNGTFIGSNPADSVLHLQLYLLLSSLPLMFLAVVIEQRSRAFAELAQQEKRVSSQYAQLLTIYRTAPVGLAFVDHQLRFVSVNDRLAEMNGISAAAHLGQTVRQVLPGLADKAEPEYRRAIETGEPIIAAEVHGVTPANPDVERDWLVSHYPVRDADGAVLGVSTIVEEITERKRADKLWQELIHASRLALLGEFTASIAHEINQPLGAILSNADAAEMMLDAEPQSVDDVRQILADIRRDILRASEVIRRLRQLLRKDEVDFQPVDLNEVVREAVALVGAEARRRGVRFRLELADHLPQLRGDKIHLQQVLINLFANGMEAMDGMTAEQQLYVQVLRDQHEVMVCVTDTGPGIPTDQMARVFDHFYSTRPEGMGMGLAITRTLIERHGGRITVENTAGAGATFRFSLPIQTRPNPEALLSLRETAI